MLYYDRVAMIEIINPSKSTRSKECMICHNRFFNRGLNFQDSVSKGCHDSTMLSVHISDIVITTIKNVDYRYIIHNIIKSKATNSLENPVLEDHGYI